MVILVAFWIENNDVKSGKSDEPVVRHQFTFISRLKKIVSYLMHEDYRVVNSEMNVSIMLLKVSHYGRKLTII